VTANRHHHRLDRIAAKLPPIRPSLDELGAEYDRLISAYTRHQTGEQAVSLASKWPISQMDTWVNELIEEGTE